MSKYKWGRKRAVGDGDECRRRGCVQSKGGEKDREEGNVNEVTYLLISKCIKIKCV